MQPREMALVGTELVDADTLGRSRKEGALGQHSAHIYSAPSFPGHFLMLLFAPHSHLGSLVNLDRESER